jgi:hypothetical protein
MILINNLLNNNLITHDLVFFGVLTSTASILGYLIFILRLGNIIIYFIKYFLNLSNKFIKKVQQYFRVFRFLTMLFILLKFIWISDLLFYSLCISIVILLGLTLYRYRRALAANMSMLVFVNSETNQITVIPNQHTWAVSNFDSVSHRFEFTLPNEQIQEITNSFCLIGTNNVISGPNANHVVERYVMPLIESSPMQSLFLEIFNPF